MSEALARLVARRDLSADQAEEVLAEVVAGEAPAPLVAALLTAWHVKGETADELAGVVRGVRGRMVVFPVDASLPPLIDTCGTGGDGASTFNVSTATALVVAGLGVAVAKHGNRSASGTSGSAEVLSELGVDIVAEVPVLRRCLKDLGLTFLFAPRFHPALGQVAAVRKLLPFRTVFNLVGPLANPASPGLQLIGAPNPRVAELMARALAGLGTRSAAVVTGAGGLDEVSLAGPTQVIWVKDGTTSLETWLPEDFGLPWVDVGALRVAGPTESADHLRRLLAGERGPARDLVLANAAAALRVAAVVNDLPEGVGLAAEAIDTGRAAARLERWVELSRDPTPA